nr:MAG TPA: hypothetical protein [Caudoviricetes sp.]
MPARVVSNPVILFCAIATIESSLSSLIANSPAVTLSILLTCAPASILASFSPSALVIRREPSTLSTLSFRSVLVA